MPVLMPVPQWKDNEFGHERHALYLGGLFAGSIVNGGKSPFVPAETPWRGWFMSEDEGRPIGWFATADEARASVEAALKVALEEA